MDLNSPSLSGVHLDELLADSDASQTCQKLLDCYVSDKNLNLLDLQESFRPSNSFISLSIKKGTEGIKKELDEINYAISVVDSLLNKTVINYTSEIIQSFDEVNEYVCKLNDLSRDLFDLNETVGKKYKTIVSLYNSVESDTLSLERLRKVYLYSLECRKLILFLKSLHKRINYLKSSVRDFLEMLLISSQCMFCLDKILSLERTDALLNVVKYCEDLKNSIIKKVYNNAYMPLFDWNNNNNLESSSDPGRELEKILVISHVIYKELSVSSKSMLELIENLVYDASSCIDLKEIMNEQNYKEWQGLFISQVSEFFLRYIRNQKSLYYICKSTKYSLIEKLDKKDREFLSNYLEKYVHEDQKEPYSLCELYTKRCVGYLYTSLSTLNQENDKYDVVMIVPQLISLGDTMHTELNQINIPFNMHKYYFKTLCEEYAKSFVSVAAKKIIPISKMCFINCVRALPNLETSPTHVNVNELNQATLMLMNLPVDNELWTVVNEFMEKSKMCPALFKQICLIVTSALETVFSNISQIRSILGTKLNLSDGGSKITLVKPNDAQNLNARLFHYLFTIVDGIESNYSILIPEDSNLVQVLDYGKSIPLISSWSDDVSSTIWHTTSYISVDNLEFNWTCNQVNIASKNVVRILNFLKDSYFDPLIQVGRYNLFVKFVSTTVSSFLVYGLTTWPLNDDEKLILLNSTTELEFTLSEILREKLPKDATEYLSFFRRLIFLTDDELFPIFSDNSSPLPKDVLLLHITCRLLRDNSITDHSLFKFLNFTSVHFMLQSFRSSLLSGEDSTNLEGLQSFLTNLNLNNSFFNNVIAHLNGF